MPWRINTAERRIGGLTAVAWTELLDGEPAADARVSLTGRVVVDAARVDEFYDRLAALIEEVGDQAKAVS